MRSRSYLFVPANEKMLGKIPGMKADAYIIDLEDSIEASEKDNALNRVISFLETYHGKKLYVRVNADRIEKELSSLSGFDGIGIMIPKVENEKAYDAHKQFLSKHEIIALIETPKGIVNVDNIAKAEWVDMLAFGAEDYSASMNMKNSLDLLMFAKSKIVNCAKAYGKAVIDTPSFQISDIDKFEKEVNLAVDMGFDGKMLISPKHIDFINESFKSNDIEFIRRIVDKYEADGKAVNVIDGVVYEKMHINRMKKIIKENGGTI